jgi:hypothetical protein
MRARSNTELDTRRYTVTLATCLPSQDELVFDHRRTSYVSWIKRYYFSILGFLFFSLSLSNHYFSWDYPFITLFARWHKNNNSKNKRKRKTEKRDIFITFFFLKKYFIWNLLFLVLFFYRSHYWFYYFLISFLNTHIRHKNLSVCNLLN